MVSYGRLFCSKMVYVFTKFRHVNSFTSFMSFTSFTSFTFWFAYFTSPFRGCGAAHCFFFVEKMTSPNFFDMDFVILDIFDQHVVKFGRKFMYIDVSWTSIYINSRKLVSDFSKSSSHDLPYKVLGRFPRQGHIAVNSQKTIVWEPQIFRWGETVGFGQLSGLKSCSGGMDCSGKPPPPLQYFTYLHTHTQQTNEK
jgi:hypothetical protein